jgi:hypothetical protein
VDCLSWGNAAPAGTVVGTVATLRESTKTLLAGNLDRGCPAVIDAKVAKMVSIKAAKPADLLPAIDAALAKLKQADPSITAETATNALTAGFCATIIADAPHPQALRALQIGNFASLVYGEFKSPSLH